MVIAKSPRNNKAPAQVLEVLQEMNALRTNPPGYAAHLREHLKSFSLDPDFAKCYKESLPEGETAGEDFHPRLISTREGRRAVIEAIRELELTPPVNKLHLESGMSLASQELFRDLNACHQISLFEKEKRNDRRMTCSMRLAKQGQWKHCCTENVCIGKRTPRDVIVSLLVDDGVPSRGHRRSLLSKMFRCCGIAIGPNKITQYLCVIDLAASFEPRVRMQRTMTHAFLRSRDWKQHRSMVSSDSLPALNKDQEGNVSEAPGLRKRRWSKATLGSMSYGDLKDMIQQAKEAMASNRFNVLEGENREEDQDAEGKEQQPGASQNEAVHKKKDSWFVAKLFAKFINATAFQGTEKLEESPEEEDNPSPNNDSSCSQRFGIVSFDTQAEFHALIDRFLFEKFSEVAQRQTNKQNAMHELTGNKILHDHQDEQLQEALNISRRNQNLAEIEMNGALQRNRLQKSHSAVFHEDDFRRVFPSSTVQDIRIELAKKRHQGGKLWHEHELRETENQRVLNKVPFYRSTRQSRVFDYDDCVSGMDRRPRSMVEQHEEEQIQWIREFASDLEQKQQRLSKGICSKPKIFDQEYTDELSLLARKIINRQYLYKFQGRLLSKIQHHSIRQDRKRLQFIVKSNIPVPSERELKTQILKKLHQMQRSERPDPP